jgi:hypothetical protein
LGLTIRLFSLTRTDIHVRRHGHSIFAACGCIARIDA